jgi:protein tyrosine phosphatase (PTP) superfamily phosphohydrolase (DUF442 family)
MGMRLPHLFLVLASWLFPAEAADPPGNYVTWRPGLASASQPSAAWLARVDAAKIDLVVNLAPPGVHGSIAEEGDIVRSRGVTYVNIPVTFAKPTAEDFHRFSELVSAYRDRNVFVHCQVNLRGTSFAFLYRVIHEGADVRESMAKLTGLWAPDRVWSRFIEETLAANGLKAEIF